MTLTDAQENPARVMFCVSRDDLYRLRVQRDELDHFIRTLLRLYNGVFTEFRPIDEGELATWSGYTVERVRELLKRLWMLRVIRYIPSNRSPLLFMNEERLPRADLYIAPETYRLRQQLLRERFEQMLAYASNEEECRSTVLERYFGTEPAGPCGVCDICLARRRAAKLSAAAKQAPPGGTAPAAEKASPGDTAPTAEKASPGDAGPTTEKTSPGGAGPTAQPSKPAATTAAAPTEPATTTAAAPTGHATTAAAARAEHAAPDDELRTRLLERLSHGAADPRTLADELAASPERITATVRELLAAGKITTGSNGKLEIIA